MIRSSMTVRRPFNCTSHVATNANKRFKCCLLECSQQRQQQQQFPPSFQIQQQHWVHGHRHEQRRSLSMKAMDPMERFKEQTMDHPLTPHLQSNLGAASTTVDDDDDDVDDAVVVNNNNNTTNFDIVFLGTGASVPTRERMTSSTLLKLGSLSFLFDAGEGLQRQLQFTPSGGFRDITKIFITHMHGDHIFGLPGLLLMKQQAPRNLSLILLESSSSSRRKNKVIDTVEIYGPPGIFNFLASNMILTQSWHPNLKVVVYELMGGRVDPGGPVFAPPPGGYQQQPSQASSAGRRFARWGRQQQHHQQQRPQQQQQQLLFRHGHYNELMTPGGPKNQMLERRQLYPNEEGVWILQDPTQESSNDPEEEQQQQASSDNNDQRKKNNRRHVRNNQDRPSNALHSGKDKKVFIKAIEVFHVPHMQTFSYIVQEQEPPMSIDPIKAKELGVKPGPKYRLIKAGQSVERDDDPNTMVHPEQVRASSKTKPRKFVLIPDNQGQLSSALMEAGQDTDVLVHEATLTNEFANEVRNRGHATAAMAGCVARDMNASVLVLNHLSKRNKEEDGVVEKEAMETNEGVSQILEAQDFLELLVPYQGFEWQERKEQ